MKKKFPRLISIILGAIFCLSFASCDGDDIEKLTDISRYSTMTPEGTEEIEVEFDNNTGALFYFTIEDEETICEIMDIVINAGVEAKEGDLWDGDNTYINIVQGNNEYRLSVRANKEKDTFYYFKEPDLQNKITELAREAGAYEPENPFTDFSAFANVVISGLGNKGYTSTKDFSSVTFTKGENTSTVSADFYDENSMVQDRVNGVCLSCGRYAFTNLDSIYKELCGDLLETLGIVADGTLEMDNILATYNEGNKQSDIFTSNGYTYFLIFHEKSEYNSFLNSWLPNFEFRVFSVDSIKNYLNSLDKSQYTQLTSNHINQPSIYASTKVWFEGKVVSVRNVENTESYLMGKVVTVQVGDISCEIWYDYAYYPFAFETGTTVEVYGIIDNFGDVRNISVKKIS